MFTLLEERIKNRWEKVQILKFWELPLYGICECEPVLDFTHTFFSAQVRFSTLLADVHVSFQSFVSHC